MADTASSTVAPPVEQPANPPVLIRQIPLKHLAESKLNPRKTFVGLDELAASIKEQGVLVPLLVRSKGDEKFEILAGARRYRAAKQAGLEDVPCRILSNREASNDTSAVEVILVENLQREDVHPMEEADVFAELLERLSGDMEALARKLSKPRSFLRQRLQLIKLIPEARKLFEGHRITLDGAMQIARLQAKDQKEVVSWFRDQGLTTGRLREMIEDNLMLELKGVPWKLDDAKLLPKAGACLTCPKRTGTEKDLFADMAKEGDRCTDRVCFEEKAQKYLEIRKAGIEAGGEKVKYAYAEWAGRDIKKGALLSSDWRPTKKGACENTQTLLLLDGKNFGKVVYGCIKKDGCKTCGTGTRETSSASESYRKQAKQQREKDKIEKELRQRVLKAVLGESKESGDNLLKRVLVAAFERLWDQSRVDLCRFLANAMDPEFTPKKGKHGGYDCSHAIAKIHSAGPGSVHDIALALAFAPDLSHHNNGEELKTYARSIGINVTALQKSVVEDLKKTAKVLKPKAAKKKVAKKK